jgi:hypothetical protein
VETALFHVHPYFFVVILTDVSLVGSVFSFLVPDLLSGGFRTRCNPALVWSVALSIKSGCMALCLKKNPSRAEVYQVTWVVGDLGGDE